MNPEPGRWQIRCVFPTQLWAVVSPDGEPHWFASGAAAIEAFRDGGAA